MPRTANNAITITLSVAPDSETAKFLDYYETEHAKKAGDLDAEGEKMKKGRKGDATGFLKKEIESAIASGKMSSDFATEISNYRQKKIKFSDFAKFLENAQGADAIAAQKLLDQYKESLVADPDAEDEGA